MKRHNRLEAYIESLKRILSIIIARALYRITMAILISKGSKGYFAVERRVGI